MTASLCALGLSISTTARAAALGNGSVTDPNIAYTGRWDLGSATAAVPNWTGGYLQTAFTGTTVKIKAREAVNFYAGVDGGADVFYAGVRGTVNLTPTPLPQGNHTLRVSYRSGDTVFQGLVLDSGATTFTPPTPKKLIEFVGDSITVGTTTSQNARTAYGWLIGERLGADHTQIAQGGAALVDTADDRMSLEQQFTKLNPNAATPDWDFSRYQAHAVVINLGTNDVGRGVSSAQFQASYTSLLRKVRTAYPNAWIFALRTFSGRFGTETKAAVTAFGDARSSSIDTTGWLAPDDLSDSVHPNDKGHRTITGRLAPVISAKLQA
ncbi:GDSL-type esterase/lipase family protein [Streptomyces antimycoticus]